MSITITADLDFSTLPTKQVRLVDRYEGLDNQYFAGEGYQTDGEGFYVETVIATDYQFECDFANGNFYSVMMAISPALARATEQNGGMYTLDKGEVQPFLALVIKARNSANLSKHERETVRDGIMINCGIDTAYLVRSLDCIMAVCQTAIRAGRGVNWA